MNSSSKHHFDETLSHFCLAGNVLEVQPYGAGHINGTYRVATSAGRKYLLQQINKHVFTNVAGLMENIRLVTAHLRNKLSALQLPDVDDRVLTLVPTHTGGYYYQDGAGAYWRIYRFISNAKSYNQASSQQQAYQSGFAFGQFQGLLTDLDNKQLCETIPNFHNIDFRMNNLRSAAGRDEYQRLERCAEELNFIVEQYEAMRELIRLEQSGQLPLRVIHNDTKFNNVLLDERDCAQCVIDLDTVMPGLVAYDFGDAVRTVISTAPEDEPDLEKIQLNFPLFEAYTAGYLDQARHFLTAEEIASLIHGVMLLPYIQAVRFLTDFLEGDHYFKTHSPDHNLQRARAQLELVKRLRANEPRIRQLIEQLADKLQSAAF